MSIILNFLILIGGFAVLVLGANWFVDGAGSIATRLKIPQMVIGLTIVALGTSAPEAAISVTAALKGSADITVGNVLGSNIVNILIILGITSLIARIPMSKTTKFIDLPILIFISALFIILGLDGNISLLDGIILIVLLIADLIYLVLYAKKNKTESVEEIKQMPLWKSILAFIIGLALIIVSSNYVVDSATEIATYFGMSERLVGLTIVAIGTSLPELVTSISAAIKGNTGLAVGNIVGSNILNIVFVVGLTALVTPVPFGSKFILDGIIALGAAVLLFACSLYKSCLNWVTGIIMLLSYVAYFIFAVL